MTVNNFSELSRLGIGDMSKVVVEVSLDGQPIEIGREGCLGKLCQGQAILDVYAPVIGVRGFIVDGQKNVVMLKGPVRHSFKHYKKDVEIVANGSGICYAPSSGNSIRLLVIVGNVVRIWEVALVSQCGRFFLRTRLVYEMRCYRSGGDIVYTRFGEKHWPQMVVAIGKLFKGKRLPPIAEYRKV